MRRVAVAVLLLAAIAAGCAIDTDSAPRDVTDERREQLRAEPPQQVRGDSSGNDRIFLVVAETGRLRTAQRETDGSPQALLASLFEGPTDEDLEEGLRSALDPFDFRTATIQDNVVTVDVSVDKSVFSGPELRLAVGQIVYTASQLVDGATAEVVIKLDGSNSTWPDGSGTERGDPLTIFDFYPMAESAQPAFPSRPSPSPAPTTAAPTTTPTTPPPSVPAPTPGPTPASSRPAEPTTPGSTT